MSGWSRTIRPHSDTTKGVKALVKAAGTHANLLANANVIFPNIYGVDYPEAVVSRIPHAGWVYRKQVGNRVRWEVLVAMKNPPVEDPADNNVLPNAKITITLQPSTASITANAATSFQVAATVYPLGTGLSYVWQVSANNGVTYANVSNGGIYANATTNTLSLANTVNMAGNLYRVVVANTSLGASVVSNSANIIFV